ncbi:MAG: hypothetical protein GVY18_11105 [Bacteroidetes bacterium]|jgi:Tol biopolymer transport system component|nr:hypothetical protein [Bacteroidota bacterium]
MSTRLSTQPHRLVLLNALPVFLLSLLLVGCGSDRRAQPQPEPVQAEVFEPGLISTPEAREFALTFTPDGQTLFFTRSTESDTTPPYTIFMAHRTDDGSWSTPEVAPFSGEHFDADPFVAPDGSGIYFFSMRPRRAGAPPLDDPDLWFAERTDDGWGPPVNLGPPVNSEAGEGFVSITRDGTLYFASDRDSAAHSIYRAPRQDGSFATPELIDAEIETNLSNPLIAPDERFLIFYSPKMGGYGEEDLFVLFREGDGWSIPTNLGPLVNTAAGEGAPGLSPDGSTLYFTRDWDIYRIPTAALDALQRDGT